MTSDLSQVLQSAKKTVGHFTDKAANSVTSETKNALDKLGNLVGEPEQTINNLTTTLTQSVSGLDESTGQLRTSFLDATGEATSRITDATSRTASTFKETTEQATGALNDATQVVVHQLNDATSSITQTAEKTKVALDETLQKTEHLSGVVANSVQDFVATSIKTWMTEHPMISWVIAHPLWTIALVLLALLLCWSLLGAIAQFTQQVWLFILQAPLKLMQALPKSAFQLLKRADTLQSMTLNAQQDTQKRLPAILNRLEMLRQEQEILMKEVHSILLVKH